MAPWLGQSSSAWVSEPERGPRARDVDKTDHEYLGQLEIHRVGAWARSQAQRWRSESNWYWGLKPWDFQEVRAWGGKSTKEEEKSNDWEHGLWTHKRQGPCLFIFTFSRFWYSTGSDINRHSVNAYWMNEGIVKFRERENIHNSNKCSSGQTIWVQIPFHHFYLWDKLLNLFRF